MDNNCKKKIQKYMALYMSIGMSIGIPCGFIFGLILFPNNASIGMCFGIPIGMCIGMAIGYAKDKRLSENMMEVSRMEATYESSDTLIFAIDKNGIEKEYKVSVKRMKREKFSVGNRVAVDTHGYLVTLECN